MKATPKEIKASYTPKSNLFLAMFAKDNLNVLAEKKRRYRRE